MQYPATRGENCGAAWRDSLSQDPVYCCVGAEPRTRAPKAQRGIPRLKPQGKENTSASDVTLRTPTAQPDGPNTKPKDLCSSQISTEIPLLGRVIVHDIPCTNRVLPLEPQDQVQEQGSPNLSPQPVSHHSIIAHPQEDLGALVIGLKEEIKELKTLMTESNTISTSTKQLSARKKSVCLNDNLDRDNRV
ncbi:hypothetical protein NDU88_000304 [Pleurodeles waltl]|uniref:Uncharacterized protein n=1 Tax=Pleurodeles waltl TaxID=8319 RepID=A0AAV7WKZ9_PLEWA|nr:hypothetical protein NDU88_000304 [Pleurodeles waltl]